MNFYKIFNYGFSTSFELSQPLKLGLDAFVFVYPKDADAVNEKISVNFVKFSAEAVQNMGMNDSELLSYAKSTFMGISKPAESFKERIILGKNYNGEILCSKIPVKSNIEVHLLTLSDNSKLCIGFKSVSEADEAEKIISEICTSLEMK